jgi:hypothetical protein
MTDPFIVLGLDPNATAAQAGDAARQICKKLNAIIREDAASQAAQQAQLAVDACDQAERAIASGGTIKSSNTPSQKLSEGLSARLRIGQLCLASHMISLEQLQEAVEEQAKSTKQLGEILQDLNFISQRELDGLLIGQDLITGDEEVKDPQALRLLAMGLITEELAVIGLLESRVSNESFSGVMNRRGWLQGSVTEAIFA